MPTDNEKAARAEAWARALMGTVPEEELQASFDRAFADHSSSFPVSAYDLKDAYARILADEQVVIEKDRKERLRQMEEFSRDENKFRCKDCYGSGYREVPDPQGSHYKGVVRCDRCEYWRFVREDLKK